MPGAPFGWIELSAEALQRLRADLEEKEKGTLDEIGVLAIHAGYADRFFPGTSALQGRARYVFFVCWNLLALSRIPGLDRRGYKAAKEKLELWLTGRLRALDTRPGGIIGVNVFTHGRPPAQPMDFIYWTALGTWGFYQRGPSRSQLARRWYPGAVHRLEGSAGAEDELMDEDPLVQVHVPPLPKGWGTDKHLTIEMQLTPEEAAHLLRCWHGVEPPCLLSTAAEIIDEDCACRPSAGHIWEDPLILEAAQRCGQEDLLLRAGRASRLAHYIRSIYAALVEQIKDRMDRQAVPGSSYREHLFDLAAQGPMRADALAVSVSDLTDDLGPLPAALRDVIERTQEGLRHVDRGTDPAAALLSPVIAEAYRRAEVARKGGRARLSLTPAGAGRRAPFAWGTMRVAPLDYRWGSVSRLLSDAAEGRWPPKPR